MKSVVIIGATSAIAQAIARNHAVLNHRLFLVGRSGGRLRAIADDLIVRGAAECHIHSLDLTITDEHEMLWNTVYEQFPKPDFAYIAHGVLPDQKFSEESYENFCASNNVNSLSVISLLTGLANRMERDTHGSITVIASVAGDRGRQSNYVYGAQKAMISVFSEGLRCRLQNSNVNVTIIKPGFVDTPMTAEFSKSKLWASAEEVGDKIVAASAAGKAVVYVPRFWSVIMLVIRCIPDVIFKRLKL